MRQNISQGRHSQKSELWSAAPCLTAMGSLRHTSSSEMSVWSAKTMFWHIWALKPGAHKHHFKMTSFLSEISVFRRRSRDMLALACLNSSSLPHTCFVHQNPALQQMAEV